VHLSVRGSLHADAVVRHAPLAFLRELDPFLKTRFPAPDAVKESGTVKP
jgi:hypothetical protein